MSSTLNLLLLLPLYWGGSHRGPQAGAPPAKPCGRGCSPHPSQCPCAFQLRSLARCRFQGTCCGPGVAEPLLNPPSSWTPRRLLTPPSKTTSCPLLSLQSGAPQGQVPGSLALSLLYGPALTSIPDYGKNHSFDYMDLC